MGITNNMKHLDIRAILFEKEMYVLGTHIICVIQARLKHMLSLKCFKLFLFLSIDITIHPKLGRLKQ